MDAHASMPFLREALLFLALAGIFIPLLQRLSINQVLGFLVIGVVVGPHGLGLWTERWPWLRNFTFPNDPAVSVLAELGVLFLMFLIGLEVSAQRLWSLRRWVFGAGLAQLVLCALALGLAARALGAAPATAAVIGAVLALSSTAVVMQLLSQRRALASPMGQATFSVLMMQDLAVVPLLILVGLLAGQGAAGGPGAADAGALVALTLGKSALVVGLIYFAGRRLLAPVFRTFARQRQPEIFFALTLLAALSIAGLTAAAGLSMALGAFLAGLLLAETEYRHEVEVTIEPFKGLLMGLFFMTVGMGIDLGLVLADPLRIAGAVAGLMLAKAMLTAAVLRAGGLGWGRALEGGLLLGQGGEFAFVVFAYAAAQGVLAPGEAQFLLLLVSLSLMCTPMVAHLGQTLGERVDAALRTAQDAEPEVAPDLAGHIVIAGCGRVGQLLGGILEAQRIAYVAVEHDAHAVARQRALGRPVHFGNAARPELLRKLHAGQAAALIVTMDQPAAAMHAVRAARAEYPELAIHARSRDERHALELIEAGADSVVPETLEAGLHLAGVALRRLGLENAEVAAITDAERERRTHRAEP